MIGNSNPLTLRHNNSELQLVFGMVRTFLRATSAETFMWCVTGRHQESTNTRWKTMDYSPGQFGALRPSRQRSITKVVHIVGCFSSTSALPHLNTWRRVSALSFSSTPFRSRVTSSFCCASVTGMLAYLWHVGQLGCCFCDEGNSGSHWAATEHQGHFLGINVRVEPFHGRGARVDPHLFAFLAGDGTPDGTAMSPWAFRDPRLGTGPDVPQPGSTENRDSVVMTVAHDQHRTTVDLILVLLPL